MNVLAPMTDPRLFGEELGGASWRPWRTALAALFGLPLEAEADRALFREAAGRESPPSAPAREGWFIVGRRGGKSRMAALVAVYLAAFRDHGAVLAPGERGTVMVLAADRRQARVVLGYVRALLAHPMLAPMVKRELREAVELTNGVNVEVHTASFRTVRGYTVLAAILDEVAFWRVEDSAEPDHAIVGALRPAMATVPGALLLGISSPYARRGVLWQAYREHFGQERSEVLVWKAASRTMNPELPASVVERAYAEDPAAAAAEYGAEFRTDVEGFLARESLEAVVVPDRRELPPAPAERYVAFTDPSGGSSDSMTLAIAHAEESGERAVLDVVRERRPPFSPDDVVRDFAAELARYGVGEVVGDRYGAEFVAERFRAHGVEYHPAPRTKSDLYRELLPAVNSGRVELLDHPRLLAQLGGLERRTARGGRDSIDHAPGAHDDVANAAAGALVLATDRTAEPVEVLGGRIVEPDGFDKDDAEARRRDAERFAAKVRRHGGVFIPGHGPD